MENPQFEGNMSYRMDRRAYAETLDRQWAIASALPTPTYSSK